eukprot:2105787-Pleurochrysis_carterae.AAC.1
MFVDTQGRRSDRDCPPGPRRPPSLSDYVQPKRPRNSEESEPSRRSVSTISTESEHSLLEVSAKSHGKDPFLDPVCLASI